MWNWANTSGALFLQTGNMSEKAVGYTTVGGDLEGAYSVIANLPKTVVIALIERLHRRYGFEGIRMTMGTTAGPELAENQSGEAELMPFRSPRRLPLPLRERKTRHRRGRPRPPEPVPRSRPPAAHCLGAEVLPPLHPIDLQVGPIPLAIHVGSLELDRERALQLPVVQRTEWSGE